MCFVLFPAQISTSDQRCLNVVDQRWKWNKIWRWFLNVAQRWYNVGVWRWNNFDKTLCNVESMLFRRRTTLFQRWL